MSSIVIAGKEGVQWVADISDLWFRRVRSSFLPDFDACLPGSCLGGRRKLLVIWQRQASRTALTNLSIAATSVSSKSVSSHFSVTTPQLLERIYASPEIAHRRAMVIEHMRPVDGLRTLDIGCGLGHLTEALGHAVGPAGAVTAIDIDPEMLTETRNRCAQLRNVQIKAGSADALPLENGTFDCAVSVQVFEYVRKVEAALLEMRRCLRRGGSAVVVATDWATLQWESRPSGAGTQLTRLFLAHCQHARLPMQLPGLAAKVGFQMERFAEIPLQANDYGPRAYAGTLLEIATAFVARTNPALASDVEAWKRAIRKNFRFSVEQRLFQLRA